MSIDMSQLEDEIEFHSRNRNLPLLPQHHPMRELLLLHPLIIFLKLSVMPEALQEARAIMHFNLHTLIRWELDVVIARLFMWRDRADKGDNPFISTFHPDINITRRTGIRIRIHQCIPLPFQDTGSESLFRNHSETRMAASFSRTFAFSNIWLSAIHWSSISFFIPTCSAGNFLILSKRTPTRHCFLAIAYSSFQSASFKESGISLAEPTMNRRKSKISDVALIQPSFLQPLIHSSYFISNPVPIIFAHVVIHMLQWSLDNFSELFRKFIHVATMEVIILW